jgi:hypothetical protein
MVSANAKVLVVLPRLAETTFFKILLFQDRKSVANFPAWQCWGPFPVLVGSHSVFYSSYFSVLIETNMHIATSSYLPTL